MMPRKRAAVASDSTAGEVDGGARLAACQSLRARRPRKKPAHLPERHGTHDKAQQASRQLRDQVDTGNGQHTGLLSKLGLEPAVSVTS